MQIDVRALDALAVGCAVLGAGGGGETVTARLALQQAIEQYGPVNLVTLDELADDDLVMPCSIVGAPTVTTEKVPGDRLGQALLEQVELLWGRPVSCLMPIEIGGANGLLPLAWATSTGRPALDADGMGRAFPEVPQVTPHLAGIGPDPTVLADDHGRIVVLRRIDARISERLSRSTAVDFGGWCACSDFQMTARQAHRATIRGTVSWALSIGDAILAGDRDPIDALCAQTHGYRLMNVKIVDIERWTSGGFVRGSVEAEGIGDDAGRLIRIEIQNENLVALEEGRVLASVPDLIVIVDEVNALPIATEALRYGQRVWVVALPCDSVWRSTAGLALAGPRAFGYEFDYEPVEDLVRAAA